MKMIIKKIGILFLLLVVSFSTSYAAERCEIDTRMSQLAKDLEKNPKLYDLIALDYDWAKTYNEIIDKGLPSKFKNLSIAQIAAIHHYSHRDGYYEKLNQELRTGTLSKHSQKFHQLLKSALAKLPDQPGTTHRGTGLQNIHLQSYKDAFENNKPIVEKHFVSSSTDVSTAEDFAEDGQARGGIYTMFTIKGKNGKDIRKLSDIPIETEVLFSSNSKFRVTNYQETVGPDGKKRILITLEEV